MKNDKSVKVYVCFYSDYEGCSSPQKVFLKENDAEDWCLNHGEGSEYEEMVLE